MHFSHEICLSTIINWYPLFNIKVTYYFNQSFINKDLILTFRSCSSFISLSHLHSNKKYFLHLKKKVLTKALIKKKKVLFFLYKRKKVLFLKARMDSIQCHFVNI